MTEFERDLTNIDFSTVMTRFASQCLKRMADLTKELEVSLGPSTGDLKGRCGLHSGPVTAGVLRGEKARFQLFGDTMNTASRMESAGIPDRIHISRETASLLEEAGKADWVSSRSEKVVLKGKGELQTYFACPEKKSAAASTERTSLSSGNPSIAPGSSFGLVEAEKLEVPKRDGDGERRQRLVHWNAEVLTTHLADVVIARFRRDHPIRNAISSKRTAGIGSKECASERNQDESQLPVHEMTDIISMPDFPSESSFDAKAPKDLIPPSVQGQLHEFVQQIACHYRDVPFHNFEHASHVTMSAGKLMKRIMNPDEVDISRDTAEVARNIHAKTYGISSDPLMQFAVVFAALIHDVDHTGLTNKELVDSNAEIALAYGEKTVAEQNSVEMAWNILMDDRFADLRNMIFPSTDEKQRFRQLLVNAVMATDIADKELQEWRKTRWETTFHAESAALIPEKEITDRKATIVFEYIIQASDVIHCMQHWLTYQKYNARLFEERFIAWMAGVPGSSNPAAGWYTGEIQFFDNYIIPLAQKLHECGVFGVSYHESLNYAQQNLVEWKQKGHDVVRELDLRCRAKHKASMVTKIKGELRESVAGQGLHVRGSFVGEQPA
jgi:3'5'-cyclic nucleotide phosphodiesterase/Adenylate and Guanylate cyclase catalytic domain